MSKIIVNQEKCKRCGLCEVFCPKRVFGEKGEILEAENCNKCGHCQILCPERAVFHEDSTSKAPKQESLISRKSEGRGGWR